MLWAIAESGKLEKTKVRRNLVGARSLEGLCTLGRLGLKDLLLFMYPNIILQWIIDCLEGDKEFYVEDFGFLFDNTSLCCLCVCIFLSYSFTFHLIAVLFLCLHLSSFYLCHLIIDVVVIIYGLDCFINSVLVYFHFPQIHCLIISLNR